MDTEALIHFIGGAAGGTAGTALTCPLEVIKTRLQSSKHGFGSSSGSTSGKPSTSNNGQGQIKTNNKSNTTSFRRYIANTPVQKSSHSIILNLFNSKQFCFYDYQ